MADEIIGLGGRIEALAPQVRRLYEAWKRWCGTRRMPARADIAPEQLRDLLPFVAIFATPPDPAHGRYGLSVTIIDTLQARPLKRPTIPHTLRPPPPNTLPAL